MKMKYFVDCGAYFQFFTPMISGFSWMLMHGCYKVPALGFEQIGVLTNKMSTDAYRGAGRPEAAFIAERLMDEVAALLKMDPVDVRRKNFIGKDAFPYTTPAGLVFDSADYEKSLAKALEISGYAKLRQEQAEARKQGRLMGIGVSTYLEICGLGPSVLFHPKIKVGGWESGGVKVDPSGSVTVLTGISPHGQGEETSFAQIVADELGVKMEDVTVLHGDTSIVHTGVGTFGSRGLALGGTALKMSLDKVKEKMRKIASHMMEAPPESLEFGGGQIFLKGQPDKAIAFTDVVAAAYGFKANIPGIEPGLEAHELLRAGELPLSLRCAHLRRRGRSRHRTRGLAALHRGRRLRQSDQSDARRGAGPRRHRAGHRPGALRDRRLRRGRTARDRHAHGLRGAEGGR